MGRTWTRLLLLVLALLALPAGAASGATHGLQVFSYEGQEQTFVVPSGVYYLEIAAAGADGGSNGGARSLGGQAAADVIVHPGERLYFEVGGVGQDVDAGDGNCQSILGNVECLGTFGGWNGGGNGGPRASQTCSAGQTCEQASSGGGGGGASDVQTVARAVGAAAFGSRLLIAGGGGGDGAPGRPGNSWGTGGDGAAAPPAGASGQASDGAAGSPAVDPSFSVGGQGGGGGGAGGSGGASWIAAAARSLGQVHSALQATPDSSGNGQIVVELQGAFSAFYDGTPQISAARASGPSVGPTVSITERCAGAPGTVCQLTTTLQPNGRRTTVTLAAGQHRTLHLRLTPAGQRRLRRGHKLKVTVRVTQRSAAGATRTVKTKPLTLR